MNALIRFAALPLCLLLAACSPQESEAPPPIRPVLSTIAEPVSAAMPVFVGVVSPQVSVAQSFRVGGTLVSRGVEVGDQVEAGAQLAVLDAKNYDLAVQNARSNLQTAEAQLANAAATESRLRALTQTQTDVVSLDNLEQAQLQTLAAEASAKQARSRLSQAEEQLGYTQLTAPFAGVVTAIGAEPGAVVGAGQSIVTLADPAARDLVIDVPESLIGTISSGTRFTIAPQLAPEASMTGTVREIAPQANPVTRSWRVKIGLDNPAELFWLGTTASATLEQGTAGRIEIPHTAIRTDGTQSFVWIIDPEKAVVTAREVSVEEAENGMVAVLSGLEGGEPVVVAGVNSLSEGQAVKLTQEQSE